MKWQNWICNCRANRNCNNFRLKPFFAFNLFSEMMISSWWGNSIWPLSSVTSCGDFWKFSVAVYLKRVAQIFDDFGEYIERWHFLSKNALSTFWATFDLLSGHTAILLHTPYLSLSLSLSLSHVHALNPPLSN